MSKQITVSLPPIIMLVEPFINLITGEMAWCQEGYHDSEWERYADFERRRLEELRGGSYVFIQEDGYKVYSNAGNRCWDSRYLIGYSLDDYARGSEANRLLKRAEFLKAVCKRECVPWTGGSDEPVYLDFDGNDDEDSRNCDWAWQSLLIAILERLDNLGLQKNRIATLKKLLLEK